MLDSIINSVKGEIGSSLMEKFGLDTNQKDKAFNIAEETIKDKVKKETSGNGLSGIMNLFSSDSNNDEGNSMLDSLGGDLVSKFSSQLGLDKAISGGIKDMMLDKVTSMIGSKLGSGFDVSSLLSLVGGEKSSGGLGGMLGKLTGLFGK
jgi:hypothetical protein